MEIGWKGNEPKNVEFGVVNVELYSLLKSAVPCQPTGWHIQNSAVENKKNRRISNRNER